MKKKTSLNTLKILQNYNLKLFAYLSTEIEIEIVCLLIK